MPNWVDTALRVTGPKEVLARFKEDARTDESPISINKLYPMPKELEGTRSPTKIVTQEEYDAYIERKNSDKLEGVKVSGGGPITQEMSDRFMKEYGANNWYDWKNNSHSTKWDLCDAYLYEDSEDELKYSFNTAWSPAENAWIKISGNYPELLFETYIEEESNDFNGRQDFQAGEKVFEELYSHIPRDDELDAVEEIRGMEPEEAIRQYIDFKGKYEYSGLVMDAIKARMAGEEVAPVSDPVEHLRF